MAKRQAGEKNQNLRKQNKIYLAKKTTLSYSDAIAELETIVNKLQNNEYEIDELQKCTTRSLELLKFCKSKLFETDEALQKILAELND
ncbi:exodeoxyribonuclease VII small subunit [Barnesiella intestinihominis]|uniref:exodeoxyribonuclease VII small subunit n=3 Tax=Barnesiella intestinihominis TaxID=487174 RepID=UPI003AAD82F5